MLDKRRVSCHHEPMTKTQDFSGHRIHAVGDTVIFAGFPVRADGSKRTARTFKWNDAGTEMGFYGPTVKKGARGVIVSASARATMNGGGFSYTVSFGNGARLHDVNGNDLSAA